METTNIKPKTIFTGDNLPIMRGINSASVDLIYLDPPFNSNANYAAPIGSAAAGAEFKDTWALDDVDNAWLDLIETKYPSLNRIIHAAITNSNKSYLIYMAVRLLEMKRILKDTGSIYLHCDPTMSHYLKLVMDSIFGHENFRNEIVWHYGKWSNDAKIFQQNHDIIFFYSNSGNYVFNRQFQDSTDKKKKIGIGYQVNHPKGVKQLIVYDRKKAQKKIEEGNYHKIIYKDADDAGVPMHDTWDDINLINSQAKERLGYPTQKPLALLHRIIKASSNEGYVVLDPFCGCATTLVAADRLQRDWIGIDISEKAAELVVQRIEADQGLFQKIMARTDIPKRTDLGDIPRYNAPQNKTLLYGEQGGDCNGCGTHFQKQHLEVDHIIAENVGGTDHIENLQLLCSNCNRIKGDRGQEYLISRLNKD